jgi:hypothetical protein
MTMSRLPTSFWDAQEIPPIALLHELGDFVLEHSEKRLPKWKFKLADDLAVQIQPQLTRRYALLFECSALQLDGVSAKFFTDSKLLPGRRYLEIGFKIFADLSGDTAWFFKPTLIGPSSAEDERIESRRRVVEVLHPDNFATLRPDMMLKASCLCCGRPLTDPVSQSRWIGSECFGSASNNLPHLFKAMAAE